MQQLLGSVMTNPYHLCHTTLIASYPDSAAVGFHQDHHHWRGSLAVNLHEREFLYVQMLYYPNGFGVEQKSPEKITRRASFFNKLNDCDADDVANFASLEVRRETRARWRRIRGAMKMHMLQDGGGKGDDK